MSDRSKMSIDDVDFDDVAILIGLGTAIADGDTSVEETFPPNFEKSQANAEEKIKNQAGSETIEAEFEQTKQPETPTAAPTDDNSWKNPD